MNRTLPISTIHLAGFDLAEIENVADQRQQVGSGSVDRFGELDLLGGQVLVGVFRQHARQNQQVVERRAQLVAHVGQEFALVLGGERELLGLFFQRFLGLLDFAVLGFHFGLLLGQQLRFFLQLGVGGLQLELLAAQLFGQRLALLQQLLGPHGGGDGVQHDADGLRELVEERQVDIVELPEGRELDDGLHVAFEQHRQHDDA